MCVSGGEARKEQGQGRSRGMRMLGWLAARQKKTLGSTLGVIVLHCTLHIGWRLRVKHPFACVCSLPVVSPLLSRQTRSPRARAVVHCYCSLHSSGQGARGHCVNEGGWSWMRSSSSSSGGNGPPDCVVGFLWLQCGCMLVVRVIIVCFFLQGAPLSERRVD